MAYEDEYKTEHLETCNIDGNHCKIETPLVNEAIGVQCGEEQVGVEYLVVIADDPYCAGRVPAKALYEELKKRYG